MAKANIDLVPFLDTGFLATSGKALELIPDTI